MTHSPCAAVTYRASDGDRDLAMLLAIDPEQATLADAWERLTAAFGAIDPSSIEIEIPPAPPGRVGPPLRLRPGPARPLAGRPQPRHLLERFPIERKRSVVKKSRHLKTLERAIRLCRIELRSRRATPF